MATTKERICETALRLFNEKGYDAVSLRDIAAAAQTSVGNVTYHFGKKEDLLAVLLRDLHKDFKSKLESGLKGDDLMKHMVSTFRAAKRSEEEYPFYFRNLNQIYASSQAVREENDAFEADLQAHYVTCMKKLQKGELVRDNISSDTFEAIAFMMVHMESTWLIESAPDANPSMDNMTIDEALTVLFAQLLTKKGRKALASAERR